MRGVTVLIGAILCAAVVTMGTPVRSIADAGSGGPAETVVRKMLDSIRKLHTTGDSDARAKLDATIEDSMALDSLSAQALGAQWSKLDPSERKHFQQLLKDLLEKVAYPQASQFFQSLEVHYSREIVKGAHRVVATTVNRAEGGAVSIDYVLERTTGGRWRVTDIDLDGQSLVQNVAAQMQAVLKQGSYANLIAQMEQRLKQPNS